MFSFSFVRRFSMHFVFRGSRGNGRDRIFFLYSDVYVLRTDLVSCKSHYNREKNFALYPNSGFHWKFGYGLYEWDYYTVVCFYDVTTVKRSFWTCSARNTPRVPPQNDLYARWKCFTIRACEYAVNKFPRNRFDPFATPSPHRVQQLP